MGATFTGGGGASADELVAGAVVVVVEGAGSAVDTVATGAVGRADDVERTDTVAVVASDEALASFEDVLSGDDRSRSHAPMSVAKARINKYHFLHIDFSSCVG